MTVYSLVVVTILVSEQEIVFKKKQLRENLLYILQ